MIDRKCEVYDLETLASVFTYTGINIDTQVVSKFVLHKDKFELIQLVNHILSLKGQIGFNNVNFDYPIEHYILKNYKIWNDLYLLNISSIEDIVNLIYKEAQRLINGQNQEGFFPSINPKEVIIPQLDLFRIWHYNNKARMTSLKALQISMNWPNVMDMPIEHTCKDITLAQVDEILKYNLNDVLATYEFYKRSSEKIALRKQIQAKYNLKCINHSDSKIGEDLMLKLYSKKMYLNMYDVKKLRSPRDIINFNDIIFDYIKFESKEFNELLGFLKTVKVLNGETKKLFKKEVIYKGFQYDYGVGGIHGCIKPGAYTSDKDYIIIDADVASLYPNIAIRNRLFIEHLGEEFIDLYDKDIIQERLRAKAAGEMSISDALKLSANSVYGKSNEATSFLYDPKYTMATTINGQLLLTKLAEMLVNVLAGTTVLQINTDGITLKIPRELQDLYFAICKDWESITNLELEYVEYDKMIIRDVNNYMAVTTKGKIKYKGAFEIDKVVGNERAYHKDNSFRIVPIAISEYFVNGVSIEETIYKHTDIYDFCGRQKFNRDSFGEIHSIIDNQINIEKQQKNVRYYISKSGKVFVKRYIKGTTELINKGFSVEIFNEYIDKEFKDYKIDYNFYIQEVYKIINTIETKQLTIF